MERRAEPTGKQGHGRLKKKGDVATYEELLGYGVGVMGLSVDDFLGLDTDEFDAAVKAFGEHEDQQERERWERMRLLGLMTVQPWSKGKLTAEKLLPLPWDKKPLRSSSLQNPAGDGDLRGNGQGGAREGNRQVGALKGAAQNHGEQEEKRMTKAEHRKRAEEMLKLLGERY